ncbi:MAG TPA: hypothetical protein VGF38_12665 [Ktedonobacterales bacterium]|jgi:hypothetical protein
MPARYKKIHVLFLNIPFDTFDTLVVMTLSLDDARIEARTVPLVATVD